MTHNHVSMDPSPRGDNVSYEGKWARTQPKERENELVRISYGSFRVECSRLCSTVSSPYPSCGIN